MVAFYILGALAVILYMLVMPAAAYGKAGAVTQELIAVRKRLNDLERKLSKAEGVAEPQRNPTEHTEPEPQAFVQPSAFPPPEQPKEKPIPASVRQPQRTQRTERPRPQTPPPPKPSIFKDWEKKIGANWSVWAGALALSVGAVMLVRYFVEADLLSPTVRCLLGAAFGFVLVFAGEGAALRGWSRPIPGVKIASVPEGLIAAGSAAVFASVYVAYGFYGLIGSGTAFVLLALVSLGLVGLSLRHGILLALVGLGAAYAVPAMIPTDAPSALGLFGYLALVTVTAHALIWKKGWTLLHVLSALASALWLLLWFGANSNARAVNGGEFGVVFAALAMMSGYLGLKHSAVNNVVFTVPEHWPIKTVQVRWATLMTGLFAVMVALSVFSQVHMSGYDLSSLAVGALALIIMVGLARWDEALMAQAYLAVLTSAGLVASWGVQFIGFTAVPDFGGGEAVHAAWPWIVAGVAASWMVMGLVLAEAARPAPRCRACWTMMAALAPVLMIAAGYGRDYVWGVQSPVLWWCLGVGAANGALALVASQRGEDVRRTDLPVYLLGIITPLILAAASLQDEVWLIVAMALSVAACNGIGVKLESLLLKTVGMILVVVMALRLVLEPMVLNDLRSGLVDMWWVLPAYALPAFVFAWSARMLRPNASRVITGTYEAVALLFAMMMVTAASRIGLGGMTSMEMMYLDAAIHSTTWLGMALALYLTDKPGVLGQDVKVSVVSVAWVFLGLIGVASVVFAPLLAVKSFVYSLRVGDVPLFNVLFPALFLPGVILIAWARAARARGDQKLLMATGTVAGAFMFIYVNLSVRQFFHGSVLFEGPSTDAEVYAYSIAWMIFAGAMVAYGLKRDLPVLRKVALVLMGVTAVKVFMFDVETLNRLYQALSYLALGGALIALGFAYQRIARLEQT